MGQGGGQGGVDGGGGKRERCEQQGTIGLIWLVTRGGGVGGEHLDVIPSGESLSVHTTMHVPAAV